MSRGADVCVVGGGLLGVATAYYASRAGLAVTLLEGSDLAAGATGHSFGGVSASVYRYAETEIPDHYVAFSREGVRLFTELEEELGPPLDLQIKGELDTFEDDAARPLVHRRVEGLRRCGVDVRFVEGDEARQIEPALSPAVRFATFCPTDGFVSPQQAVWALADGARRHGARIRTRVAVTGVNVVNGRAVGVSTVDGDVDADWIVIAAGTGTPALLESAGAAVPLVTSRGQMFVTERVPPFLRTFVHNVKQTVSGTVLVGATVEPGLADQQTTVAGTRDMLRKAVRLIPRLGDLRLVRSWAGVRIVPPDGYPILGPLEAPERVLVAAMHRGITLAPAVGRALTDLIVSGNSEYDLAPYDPSRFTGRDPESPEARVKGRPDYVY